MEPNTLYVNINVLGKIDNPRRDAFAEESIKNMTREPGKGRVMLKKFLEAEISAPECEVKKAFKLMSLNILDMGFLKKFQNHLVAPKADLNLQLDDSYVALGDDLEGALIISPREDIEATEIRCEINCVETAQVIRNEYDPVIKRMVPRQVTETKVLYSAKPACSPAIQLINGITKEFKLNISIPVGARPTLQSINDQVDWKIKGVIGVHGRPDVTTKEQCFQVVMQSQRPLNEPAKVKLVECEYCQKAMPENILVCPNCGARRTI